MLLDGRDIFGAAGASLLKFTGGEGTGLAVLALTLALWIIVPAGLALTFLRRQDI
jgi:Cu-processing system permease protein